MNRTPMRQRRARKGFTLLEIMFVIMIVAVIGGAVAAFERNVVGLNGIIQDDLTGQQEMRKTVKDFVSEARSAAPSATGAYPLSTVATSTFMFYSDIDGDNKPERLRYFLSGKTLKKGVIAPSGSPLTYNAANEKVSEVVHDLVTSASSIFEYFDANYDGTSAALAQPVNVLNVRLVKINLTVDRNPSRAPGPVSITAQSAMRNLKDNL